MTGGLIGWWRRRRRGPARLNLLGLAQQALDDTPPPPRLPPLDSSADATARACKLDGHPYDHDDADGLGLCRCGARWFTPTPKD